MSNCEHGQPDWAACPLCYEESVEKLRDRIKELEALLPSMKEYVEQSKLGWDWERGSCRELDEIIADGDMPAIYNTLLTLLGGTRDE
jgi:hypothetical protein